MNQQRSGQAFRSDSYRAKAISVSGPDGLSLSSHDPQRWKRL